MSLADDARDVRKALAIEDGLSDWEVNFLESIGARVLDDHRALTEKQREVLDGILEEHT